MKFKISCFILALFFITSCSSKQVKTESISEIPHTQIPTITHKPTDTQPPTSTPEPTETSIPLPTNTSTPTVTPTPVIIRIEADGSGDYASLEDALNEAPEGANIYLGTGVYNLDKKLNIGKSLQLIGSGVDETEIVSDDSDYVMYIAGQESFGIKDLSIMHKGDNYGHVLRVENVNKIEFENCRFIGAVYNEGLDMGGWGLKIDHQVYGVVKNCEAVDNQLIGIGVVSGTDSKSKEIKIEENICKDNGNFGIAVLGDSYASLLDNTCSGNTYSGILVSDRSSPTIENNSLTNNGESGIIFSGNSKGIARNNIMSNNRFSGITIMRDSEPLVEDNTAQENLRDGISLFDNAQGEIISNELRQNKFDGISVNDNANPMIKDNLIQDNGKNGISFLAESSGEATQNECSGNMQCVYIEDTANPEVADNNCHDNLVGDPEVEVTTETVETSTDEKVYSGPIKEFLCGIEDIEVEFDMLIPEEPLQLSSEDYLNMHPDPDFAKEFVENAEWSDYWYLNMRYTKFDSSGETLLGTLGSINCSVTLHETVNGAVNAFENPYFYPPEEISPASSDLGIGQQSMLEIYDSNSRLLFRYQNITAHVEITQMEPKVGSDIIKAIAENMLERIQAAPYTTP